MWGLAVVGRRFEPWRDKATRALRPLKPPALLFGTAVCGLSSGHGGILRAVPKIYDYYIKLLLIYILFLSEFPNDMYSNYRNKDYIFVYMYLF